MVIGAHKVSQIRGSRSRKWLVGENIEENEWILLVLVFYKATIGFTKSVHCMKIRTVWLTTDVVI